jgi:hypothetical protein
VDPVGCFWIARRNLFSVAQMRLHYGLSTGEEVNQKNVFPALKTLAMIFATECA